MDADIWGTIFTNPVFTGSLTITSGSASPVFYVDSLGAHASQDATTPNGLVRLGQFSASIGSNGYQKLPSGLIIQWGYLVTGTTSAGNVVVTFPVAFPTAALVPMSCSANGVATPTVTGIAVVSKTSMSVYFLANTTGLVWYAIGY